VAPPAAKSVEAPIAAPDAVAPPPEAWKKADAAKKAKDAGTAGRLNLAQCRSAIARIGARVPFATSASGLGPQGQARVARLADIIARCEGVRVSIEGHTDRRGASGANQRLSERRAQAVLSALVAQGAPEPVLTARGFGETRPLRTERSARADAVNRRVIIVVRANEGNR
jgi:OOP family OmpA-OmpF porin